MGAQYDVARTRLDVAGLTHRRGEREATGAHLEAALRLFTTRRIPRYVARTRRLCEELGVTLPR
jgi:hypothetical protein